MRQSRRKHGQDVLSFSIISRRRPRPCSKARTGSPLIVPASKSGESSKDEGSGRWPRVFSSSLLGEEPG